MCGISGWVDWSENLYNKQNILKNMTQSITHRGPDADGYWFSERAAFGHQRLIVIDPEGGLQPMIDQDNGNTIVLTYNGELYNFLELRQELEKKGYIFKTNSDTEVLLRSYVEWKEDCVHHFNGIYAFAIWDQRRQQLMLGRDHLGVKPLFYTQKGTSLIFGSEPKVLLAHPLVEARINREGLAEIFALGPIRTPGNGVFQDIQEVRAGHYMIFTANGSSNIRYWNLKSHKHTEDVETTVAKIHSLLEDSVNRQLIADKPVVCMLSGGLDSSGLTALAAKNFKGKGKALHTYSIDFINNNSDFKEDFLRRDRDEPWVKRVAEYVGTNHHSIIFGAKELAENLLEPMRARDLPGMGELETSLYLLFKEMKKDATVALSGESADEVFSGYPWFYQEQFLNAEKFPWLVQLGSISSILKDDIKEKIQPEEYLRRRFKEAISEIPFLEGEEGVERKQRQMSYLFITRFLPFMLDRKDRASMMTGFEVRVPFCDYRLVEYLWNVPFTMKSIDNIEKGILRRAFKGILPEDVRNRKKSAYPSTKDDAYFNLVSKWMVDILDDPKSPILALIDRERVRTIAEDQYGTVDRFKARGLFDYLIQINYWLKEYQIEIAL